WRAAPISVAREWGRYGFRRLHVVDLDAATGRGSNRDVVNELLREVPVDLQGGGGIRGTAAIDELVADGARAVVLGTRAFEDADWLGRVANAYPNEILVAADVRDRRGVTQGGTRRPP